MEIHYVSEYCISAGHLIQLVTSAGHFSWRYKLFVLLNSFRTCLPCKTACVSRVPWPFVTSQMFCFLPLQWPLCHILLNVHFWQCRVFSSVNYSFLDTYIYILHTYIILVHQSNLRRTQFEYHILESRQQFFPKRYK